MKEASGKNENPFYRTYDIKTPIVSEKSKFKGNRLKETIIYDLKTEKGREYVII